MILEELNAKSQNICMEIIKNEELKSGLQHFNPDRACSMVVGYCIGRGLNFNESSDVWKVVNNFFKKYQEKGCPSCSSPPEDHKILYNEYSRWNSEMMPYNHCMKCGYEFV